MKFKCKSEAMEDTKYGDYLKVKWSMEKVKKKKWDLLHDPLLYVKVFTHKNNDTDFMTIQRIVSNGYRE